MKFSLLPHPVRLLKLLLFFARVILKGESSAGVIFFSKYTIIIVMCQDPCEPFCFRSGMMLYTTTLCSLISVWLTLMFTQGHRVTGKLELCHSLGKINFRDGYIKEMTMKKSSKYGEYGSFQHLLFLCSKKI